MDDAVPLEGLGLLLILRAFAAGSVALTGTEASQRCPGVQGTGGAQRRPGADPDGNAVRDDLPGDQLPRLPARDHPGPVGAGDGDQPDRPHALRRRHAAALPDPAVDRVPADPRRQHRVRGLPRLASILGKDRFLPRQFQYRGDRLAYSFGIMVLALLAAGLVAGFGGSVTNLIPLYTVGVFIAFTLSQSGMVVHWWRLRHEVRGWRWRAALNGAGATATGVVAIIVGVVKFALGAWMVLLLIPVLIGLMWAIGRHYRSIESALAVDWTGAALPRRVAPASWCR